MQSVEQAWAVHDCFPLLQVVLDESTDSPRILRLACTNSPAPWHDQSDVIALLIGSGGHVAGRESRHSQMFGELQDSKQLTLLNQSQSMYRVNSPKSPEEVAFAKAKLPSQVAGKSPTHYIVEAQPINATAQSVRTLGRMNWDECLEHLGCLVSFM